MIFPGRFLHSILLTFLVSVWSLPAFARATFGLSGHASDNHVGYNHYEEQSASASFSIDLGSYFRIGLTHAQKVDKKSGYLELLDSGGNTVPVEYYDITTVVSNSLDLTLVLYQGAYFTPFIFGGPALKTYRFQSWRADTNDKLDAKSPTIPAASGGLGCSFMLSQQFTLRVSRTWSAGSTKDPVTGKARGMADSYTRFGVDYSF